MHPHSPSSQSLPKLSPYPSTLPRRPKLKQHSLSKLPGNTAHQHPPIPNSAPIYLKQSHTNMLPPGSPKVQKQKRSYRPKSQAFIPSSHPVPVTKPHQVRSLLPSPPTQPPHTENMANNLHQYCTAQQATHVPISVSQQHVTRYTTPTLQQTNTLYPADSSLPGRTPVTIQDNNLFTSSQLLQPNLSYPAHPNPPHTDNADATRPSVSTFEKSETLNVCPKNDKPAVALPQSQHTWVNWIPTPGTMPPSTNLQNYMLASTPLPHASPTAQPPVLNPSKPIPLASREHMLSDMPHMSLHVACTHENHINPHGEQMTLSSGMHCASAVSTAYGHSLNTAALVQKGNGRPSYSSPMRPGNRRGLGDGVPKVLARMSAGTIGGRRLPHLRYPGMRNPVASGCAHFEEGRQDVGMLQTGNVPANTAQRPEQMPKSPGLSAAEKKKIRSARVAQVSQQGGDVVPNDIPGKKARATPRSRSNKKKSSNAKRSAVASSQRPPLRLRPAQTLSKPHTVSKRGSASKPKTRPLAAKAPRGYHSVAQATQSQPHTIAIAKASSPAPVSKNRNVLKCPHEHQPVMLESHIPPEHSLSIGEVGCGDFQTSQAGSHGMPHILPLQPVATDFDDEVLTRQVNVELLQSFEEFQRDSEGTDDNGLPMLQNMAAYTKERESLEQLSVSIPANQLGDSSCAVFDDEVMVQADGRQQAYAPRVLDGSGGLAYHGIDQGRGTVAESAEPNCHPKRKSVANTDDFNKMYAVKIPRKRSCADRKQPGSLADKRLPSEPVMSSTETEGPVSKNVLAGGEGNKKKVPKKALVVPHEGKRPGGDARELARHQLALMRSKRMALQGGEQSTIVNSSTNVKGVDRKEDVELAPSSHLNVPVRASVMSEPRRRHNSSKNKTVERVGVALLDVEEIGFSERVPWAVRTKEEVRGDEIGLNTKGADCQPNTNKTKSPVKRSPTKKRDLKKAGKSIMNSAPTSKKTEPLSKILGCKRSRATADPHPVSILTCNRSAPSPAKASPVEPTVSKVVQSNNILIESFNSKSPSKSSKVLKTPAFCETKRSAENKLSGSMSKRGANGRGINSFRNTAVVGRQKSGVGALSVSPRNDVNDGFKGRHVGVSTAKLIRKTVREGVVAMVPSNSDPSTIPDVAHGQLLKKVRSKSVSPATVQNSDVITQTGKMGAGSKNQSHPVVPNSDKDGHGKVQHGGRNKSDRGLRKSDVPENREMSTARQHHELQHRVISTPKISPVFLKLRIRQGASSPGRRLSSTAEERSGASPKPRMTILKKSSSRTQRTSTRPRRNASKRGKAPSSLENGEPSPFKVERAQAVKMKGLNNVPAEASEDTSTENSIPRLTSNQEAGRKDSASPERQTDSSISLPAPMEVDTEPVSDLHHSRTHPSPLKACQSRHLGEKISGSRKLRRSNKLIEDMPSPEKRFDDEVRCGLCQSKISEGANANQHPLFRIRSLFICDACLSVVSDNYDEGREHVHAEKCGFFIAIVEEMIRRLMPSERKSAEVEDVYSAMMGEDVEEVLRRAKSHAVPYEIVTVMREVFRSVGVKFHGGKLIMPGHNIELPNSEEVRGLVAGAFPRTLSDLETGTTAGERLWASVFGYKLTPEEPSSSACAVFEKVFGLVDIRTHHNGICGHNSPQSPCNIHLDRSDVAQVLTRAAASGTKIQRAFTSSEKNPNESGGEVRDNRILDDVIFANGDVSCCICTHTHSAEGFPFDFVKCGDCSRKFCSICLTNVLGSVEYVRGISTEMYSCLICRMKGSVANKKRAGDSSTSLDVRKSITKRRRKSRPTSRNILPMLLLSDSLRRNLHPGNIRSISKDDVRFAKLCECINHNHIAYSSKKSRSLADENCLQCWKPVIRNGKNREVPSRSEQPVYEEEAGLKCTERNCPVVMHRGCHSGRRCKTRGALSGMVCPRHKCSECTTKGEAKLVRCRTCPATYCKEHLPQLGDIHIFSEKLIACPKCRPKLHLPQMSTNKVALIMTRRSDSLDGNEIAVSLALGQRQRQVIVEKEVARMETITGEQEGAKLRSGAVAAVEVSEV